MVTVYLLISDIILRDAVVEQISAAGMGLPRIVSKIQEAVPSELVIIDEDDFDKKTAGFLSERADKPAIFLLGDGGQADLATETFAKPFRLGHLITRIRYHIETAPLLRGRIITFGGYRLEPQNRRLFHEKKSDPIRLTEKETALLVYLADCKAPATRQDILASVWGYDEHIDTHTLETHVYQLRRKLDEVGENWLICEAGAYRLSRGSE